MKKLLYIGHAYHNRTKSTQFLKDILSEKYEITQFDFDPYSDRLEKFEELSGQYFDVVVLFQIMPSIYKLTQYLTCKQFVFFPMYDGAPEIENPIWNEYKRCIIINFSKTLHERCKSIGLASFYIQYFPKPEKILNKGKEDYVFLWQRTNQVTINTIEKTLDIDKIKHIYLHNAPDPGYEFLKPPAKCKDKCTVSTWFDTKEQMNEYLQECAIYYAPRQFEGIGMSFLEAMAVGRCVIAPNFPTMNEYIQNGVTGYLYDFRKLRQIPIKNVRKIQENTIKYIEQGYKSWELNKHRILDWVEADVNKYSNKYKQNTRMLVCTPKKKQIKLTITYAIKKTTENYVIYYLFGKLPIFFKKRRKK